MDGPIFTLTVRCEGAAFNDLPYSTQTELARILRDVAGRLWDREETSVPFGNAIHDANGNRCGEYVLE